MVDSTPLIPSDKKQGHRVLCCCDSRKAVIIINMLALAWIIYVIILGAVQGTLSADIVQIVFYALAILFPIIVMCSAIQFHRCAVIIAIIFQVIAVVLHIIALIGLGASGELAKLAGDARNTFIVSNVIWFIIYLVVLYSEIVYVREVKHGIMSRQNHARERYSW